MLKYSNIRTVTCQKVIPNDIIQAKMSNLNNSSHDQCTWSAEAVYNKRLPMHWAIATRHVTEENIVAQHHTPPWTNSSAFQLYFTHYSLKSIESFIEYNLTFPFSTFHLHFSKTQSNSFLLTHRHPTFNSKWILKLVTILLCTQFCRMHFQFIPNMFSGVVQNIRALLH